MKVKNCGMMAEIFGFLVSYIFTGGGSDVDASSDDVFVTNFANDILYIFLINFYLLLSLCLFENSCSVCSIAASASSACYHSYIVLRSDRRLDSQR